MDWTSLLGMGGGGGGKTQSSATTAFSITANNGTDLGSAWPWAIGIALGGVLLGLVVSFFLHRR